MNLATGPTTEGRPRRERWWADPRLRPGLVICAGLLLMAALAGVLAPGDPTTLGEAGDRLSPPSGDHPLGTDALGRDVLVRLLHGSRASLLVGWVSVLLAVTLGTGVGLASGLGPGWLDRILMHLADTFMAFPRIFLVLLLVSLTSPSLLLVMAVLGLTGWMPVARLVRAETLAIKAKDYVAAARGLGLSPARVAFRHVLPNLLPTVLVAASLRVGGAILTESFLSYLGLGAQEPTVSWGAMIQQGRAHLLEGWWLTTFPGLAVSLTLVGYNLLGEGLRSRLAAPGPVKEGPRE